MNVYLDTKNNFLHQARSQEFLRAGEGGVLQIRAQIFGSSESQS